MFKTKRSRIEPAEGEPTWSSSEVAKLGGVSLRQLQWWDEQKVVSPHHEGHRRVYSAAQVIEIAVIAELRRKGFSLQKIRRVVRFLQREMGKRLADLLAGASELHLLTDGKSVSLEDSEHRVVEVLKSAKQAMFLVCVSDQARHVTQPRRKPVRRETAPAASARRLKSAAN